MSTPPHRSLAYPADITPPGTPTERITNPTDSLATTPIPNTLFALPGSPIHYYSSEQKAYIKAQPLRCLPLESSPLVWSEVQKWVWEDGEWIEQINVDHKEDIEMDHDEVEDFEMILNGMTEQPIEHRYPPTSSSALPASTSCPPSPRPARKEIRPSPSLDMSGFGSGYTKLRLKTPMAAKQEMMRGWIERNTPRDSSTPPPKENISVSPGSSRTKIVIRRSPPDVPPNVTDIAIPSSSAALANITHQDLIAEQSPITPSTLNYPLSNRKPRYPNLQLVIRPRLKSDRHYDKEKSYVLVGGKTKLFNRDDWYIQAILCWWQTQVSLRMSIGDIYVNMGSSLPKLASPPPGLDRMPGLEKWIAPTILAIRSATKPKRSRHSPEKHSVEAGGMEVDGKEEEVRKSPSPSDGQRKRGKVSAEELLSAVMTRQPSPTYGPPEPIDQTDSTRWVQPYPTAIMIKSPEDTPLLDTTRYYTNPRTGRRAPLPTPIELPKPSILLASHFSPDTPGSESAEQPWEISYIEYRNHDSSLSSRTGSPIRQINRLGLDLGANDSGWSSSVSSTPEMRSSGTQTPILPSDIARVDQEMNAEERRVQLCDAIEKLAEEYTDRVSEAEWTPPMREPGIDDTPSTVADELITTPDVDMADLPMSENPTPIPKKPSDSDEEEEVNRPRIDKGKGRARTEDDTEAAGVPRRSHEFESIRRGRSLQNHKDEDEDEQVILERLVMEVSRLEAEQAELESEGGESPDGTGMLQRKIKKINRRIKKLSEGLGYVSHLDMDVEMTTDTHADGILAANLQKSYEEEEAIRRMEDKAKAEAWNELGGVPMSRFQTARSTAPGYQYDPYIPKPLQSRHSATARQLTFGDEDNLVSDPIRRGPVTQLLARSSIFEKDSIPPHHSFTSGGIRLSGRNRSSGITPPLSNGPIKPPTLYPIPQTPNDGVKITVTPPTPLEELPQPIRHRLAPRARMSSLTDPLEMSALAGALGDQVRVSTIEVELDLEEDLEMEEAIEDTGSESTSSEETIRHDQAASITRALSEAFETPTVGRGGNKRPLVVEDDDEEEVMEFTQPTFQEEPVRPQRPARVLFGSPERQERRKDSRY